MTIKDQGMFENDSEGRRAVRQWGRIQAAIWAGVLCLTCIVTEPALRADPKKPRPPAWLEIEPNASEDRESPMIIRVGGIPQGSTVRLVVTRDCDGDDEPDLENQPDLESQTKCRAPLFEWESTAANQNNEVIDSLDLRREDLPGGVRLWLLAFRPGSDQGRQVIFGVVKEPCSLWTSLVETFFGGECRLDLKQALRQHRTPMDLEDFIFEVRTATIEGNGEPEIVPVRGTRGATGVAWINTQNLAVTVAPLPGGPPPGLYRVPVDGGEPRLLWQPDADDPLRPVAPLSLDENRIALVRQHLGQPDVNTPAAFLNVWEAGRIGPGIPLAFKIHQLVAAEDERVLALTLGVADSRAGFLEIDLRSRRVIYHGFHPKLYRAAMRSPTGDPSVISMEDAAGDYGWSLMLVDSQNNWSPLQRRFDVHDLMPTWRPDGAMVAFLAEIDRVGR